MYTVLIDSHQASHVAAQTKVSWLFSDNLQEHSFVFKFKHICTLKINLPTVNGRKCKSHHLFFFIQKHLKDFNAFQ